MKKIAFIALALLMGVMSANAQLAAGRVVRMSDFSIADLALFSQQDYTFSTARSAAMGGAFVSLGADMSSMALNPAGLGMYRSSEFSLSPSLTWTKSSDRFLNGAYATNSGAQRETRMAMGNIGLALNLFQSTGPLTSLTLGFGYSKLADFNYSSSVGSDKWGYSILDVYAEQLMDIGMTGEELLNRPWDNPNIYPHEWGAVSAYDARAIDGGGNDRYYWANIDGAARVDNMLTTQTRGSLGEFDIAAGMNFSNRLYVGFTMGIQSLLYRQDSYYEEFYDQGVADQGPAFTDQIVLNQRLRYTGVGVNFKLGFVLRPVEELRIGFALHSPTIMTLDREYRVRDFWNRDQAGNEVAVQSDYLSWRYEYASPTRMMAGISYQLGGVSLLAFDYERAWYNGMRVLEDDEYYIPDADREQFKQDIKNSFRGTDNFRFGLEVKFSPEVYVRGGYALSLSPLNDKADDLTPTAQSSWSRLDNPLITRSESYSAGVGYRKDGFSIDAAYVRTNYKFSNYSAFWYDNPAKDFFNSGTFAQKLTRGMATLTLGFRF